jgi:hypothetical protein
LHSTHCCAAVPSIGMSIDIDSLRISKRCGSSSNRDLQAHPVSARLRSTANGL